VDPIKMPTLFLPPESHPPGDCALSLSLVDRYGGVVRQLVQYPLSTGTLGTDFWRDPESDEPAIDVLVTNATRHDLFLRFMSNSRPDWTILDHVWYNGKADAAEVVRVLSPHTNHLVVPCINHDALSEVPEDAVVGYYGGLPTKKVLPRIDLDRLCGRDVCLVRGTPFPQWLNYCMLTVHGARVVGMVPSKTWFLKPEIDRFYWGRHLNRVPLGEHTWQEGAALSVQNMLAHWMVGIQTMNAFYAR